MVAGATGAVVVAVTAAVVVAPASVVVTTTTAVVVASASLPELASLVHPATTSNRDTEHAARFLIV